MKAAARSRLRKVSWRSLSRGIDCTPEGRQNCLGACCAIASYGGGRYWSREYGRAMSLGLPFVIVPRPIKQEFVYRLNGTGYCEAVDDCASGRIYKPIQCRLFPLKLNQQGTLMVSRWVNLQCPNANAGPPLYKALQSNLIDVFGEEWYEELLCIFQTR